MKKHSINLKFIHLYKVLFHGLSFTHRQVIQTAQHLYTEGDGQSHLPQAYTESSKLTFRAGFFYPFNRVTLVGVPCVGDARSSHGISVQDNIATPKTDAWASIPISPPRIMNLQSVNQREVKLKLPWPFVSFEPHQCDQYFCHQNTNVDFHTLLIPLH